MPQKRIGSRVDRKIVGALVSALVFAALSCAGGQGTFEGAAKKMLSAYGGSEKAARLQGFIGRGFIKDLTEKTVARSLVFDIYRRGDLYKHRIIRISAGKITDVLILRYDGKESTEWESRRGLSAVASMELGLQTYRFPAVILWAREPGRAGEMLPAEKGEGVRRVRYRDGDITAVLSIDAKSWLLRGVSITMASDTSFVFTEAYDHYSDIDGIPFPQEFKATFKGLPYYEYILPTVRLAPDLPDSLFQFTREDTTSVGTATIVDRPGGAAQ